MADLLIVDDDADLAEAVAMVLAGMGHTVRVSTDGRAGLTEVRRQRPDLVLLDVEMPILSGPSMARAMLILDLGLERIPIVLVSGAAHLLEAGVAVGTPYLLSKPYSIDALRRLIDQALRDRVPPSPRPRL